MAKFSSTSIDRHKMMLEMAPEKLLIKMAIPTIIAMIVESIYNLADTFFVSSIGENATAAVAVNDSFMNILVAIGGTFSFGLSSYVPRLLGAKKDKQASTVASTIVAIAVCVSFVSIIVIWPIRAWIIQGIGGTPEAMKYSVDYATYIVLAFPFTMMNGILNQLHKSEGNTRMAMFGTVVGAIINCILDPLFIWVFRWEVAGAAGATALSKMVSFAVLVYPFVKKRTVIDLSLKNFKFDLPDFLEVMKMGLPALVRMTLMSFGGIVTNRAARTFGTAVLAAISVANKIYRFISSTIMGFSQGFSPCAGYCWGAKSYKRTKTLFFTTIKIGAIGGFILSIVMFIFAPNLINIFNHTANPVITSVGMFKLRVLCFGLIPHIFTMVTGSLHQALGRPVGSAVLSLSRQLLFLIPMVKILPIYFNEYGVAAAQGISDICAGVFLALPFALHVMKIINKMENEKNETIEENVSI